MPTHFANVPNRVKWQLKWWLWWSCEKGSMWGQVTKIAGWTEETAHGKCTHRSCVIDYHSVRNKWMDKWMCCEKLKLSDIQHWFVTWLSMCFSRRRLLWKQDWQWKMWRRNSRLWIGLMRNGEWILNESGWLMWQIGLWKHGVKSEIMMHEHMSW